MVRWRSDFAALVRFGLTLDGGMLFTAADAHMRDFHVVVPADCVVVDGETRARALGLLDRTIGADLTPSDALDLERLGRGFAPPLRSRR